jgi:predicted Zn-dependent peptidase
MSAMERLQHSVKQLNGLSLHTIRTAKYKTNTIVLQLNAPLTEREMTSRALLPYVLQSATEFSRTTRELRGRLNDLYGATLYVQPAKKGNQHVLSLRMDVANESYLRDSTPLLKKALRFLAEVILQPKLENGVFDRATVEKEKRTLKQRIESVHDDKMRYANKRLLEEMYKNDPYRLHVFGTKSDVNKITPETLYKYYQHVLENDAIDLYVVGDIDENDVQSITSDAFILPNYRQNSCEQTSSAEEQRDVQENIVTESDDIEQGKLHLGYRTFTTYGDEDYYALQLCNGIFGGFSHSKLFVNVREKESLAYYAASRIESHKGFLMVMAGIEFANYDKAVKIIKEQMKKMQKGDFSETEFLQTKAMLTNQLLETMDSPKGMIEFAYNGVVSGRERTVEDWLSGIENVSREQIVEAANKIKLDTVYFLKGKEV